MGDSSTRRAGVEIDTGKSLRASAGLPLHSIVPAGWRRLQYGYSPYMVSQGLEPRILRLPCGCDALQRQLSFLSKGKIALGCAKCPGQ